MLVIVALFVACPDLAGATPPEPPVRSGQFEVSQPLADLVDAETIDSLGDAVSADGNVTWMMYVPDSYDPSLPAGLMVYISPVGRGFLPRGWQDTLDDSNLIWIAANQSGNDAPTERRMLLAVLGTQIASALYSIDPDRVYLSGFSGGGKTAGLVAIHFANLFKGAIYICGAEFWTNDPPALMSQVLQNRYVFLTGDEDFNRTLTRRVYNRYERAGVPNINLIIVPGMAHSNPGGRDLDRAIRFLDEREEQ